MKLLQLKSYFAYTREQQLRGLVKSLAERDYLLIGLPVDISEGSEVHLQLKKEGEFALPKGTTHLVFTRHVFGHALNRDAVYAVRLRKIRTKPKAGEKPTAKGAGKQ